MTGTNVPAPGENSQHFEPIKLLTHSGKENLAHSQVGSLQQPITHSSHALTCMHGPARKTKTRGVQITSDAQFSAQDV